MNREKEWPMLAFATSEAWKEWLAKNHSLSSGIWLHFFKKDSGVTSISYDEALDEALCYGWKVMGAQVYPAPVAQHVVSSQ